MSTPAPPHRPLPDAATLARILEGVADGITVQEPAGRLTYANAAAARILGYPSAAALLAAPVSAVIAQFEMLDEAGHPFPLHALPGRLVLTGAPTAEAIVGYRIRATGEVHWALVRARPYTDPDGRSLGVVNLFHDLTAERAAAAAQAAAATRATFLAEASALLARSLDYETTLAQIADLAVPTIADWCTVDLVTPTGQLALVALSHASPAKRDQAIQLERRYPPDPADPTSRYGVLRTGRPAYYPSITDDMLQAAARDPDHLAFLRAVGLRGVLLLPLPAREGPIGVLTLSMADSGRTLSPDDVTLATDLAARAALAIENARLYREAQLERDRFAITLASIGDAVIATDPAGRITFLNPVAAQLTGWDAEEARGQDLATVCPLRHEETGAPVVNPVAQVLASGAVVGLTNHTLLQSRDGALYPIDDSAAPIRDAAGLLRGVVLVFHDVSERRRAEAAHAHQAAALAAERARLARILDQLPVGVFLAEGERAGRTFRSTLLNAVAQAQIRAPVLTPHARTPTLTICHPDGTPYREDELPLNVALWTGQAPREQELLVHYGDGEERTFLASTALVTSAPERREAVVVWRDITERRQAADGQRFLAQATAALTASLDYPTTQATVARVALPVLADTALLDLLDADGVVVRVAIAAADPALEGPVRELQQRYPPDPHGQTSRRVLESRAPLLVPEVTDTFLDAVAQNPAHRALLAAIGTRAFVVLPLVTRARVLGTLTLGLGAARRPFAPVDLPLLEELARRAALALDNARLYQEAQTAIGLRDEFLTVAAHELRTPLTALQAGVQLLQRGLGQRESLDDRDLRRLEIVRSQAGRLGRLVYELLDLSRLDAGHLALESERVDLRALVGRVVSEVNPLDERHPLAITLPPAPVDVWGDPLRLEQVVQNLVQNAIQYSPHGGPIAVTLQEAGDHACLAVTDAGIGIPAAALPHLFTRFYRAPNVGPGILGMGIGLYLVQAIVTRHGGAVTVTSQEGQGSTFTVCLPRLAPGAPAPA